jgi:hypothetical protein
MEALTVLSLYGASCCSSVLRLDAGLLFVQCSGGFEKLECLR